MNEYQRSIHRHFRLLSWVLTVVTVAFIVMSVELPVPGGAAIGLSAEFILVTAWFHAITWAFPYLCRFAAIRDRSSSEGP